jgi:hypothetical protein
MITLLTPPVESIEEEDHSMGLCSCSGAWRLAGNAVWPKTGRWIDHVDVTCSNCGARRAFEFDVTSFIEARPGIWNNMRPVAT